KDDAGPGGHGLATLAEIRTAVALPLVAIGGITAKNVADVIAAGADGGVAVISAVVGQDDVTAAARDLRARIVAAKANQH
ncbi:thiamine phosphate synthase, partial [Methanoculleus chikugoensis]|uniref:thiamine phosphate synthase n=1 Tax=Methanoculleus chikugoensis TaxID=118126 RepID=UPI000A7AFFDF